MIKDLWWWEIDEQIERFDSSNTIGYKNTSITFLIYLWITPNNKTLCMGSYFLQIFLGILQVQKIKKSNSRSWSWKCSLANSIVKSGTNMWGFLEMLFPELCDNSCLRWGPPYNSFILGSSLHMCKILMRSSLCVVFSLARTFLASLGRTAAAAAATHCCCHP